MKISIIIPFYNVQEYISRCISSVKKQTFTDFQCILVDDKSTDNSYNKAIETINGDPRFSIIRHTENKRQGGARNTGINYAQAPWITFLDSDDLWEPNYLERMYQAALDSQADIIVCQLRKINDQNQISNFRQLSITGLYTNKNQLIDIFLQNPTTCNKLYRSSIWSSLRFPEKLFQEDLATCFQIVFYAEKVLFIEDPLYLYYQRTNSTSKHFCPQLIEERIAIFKIMKQVIAEKLNNDLNRTAYIYLNYVVYATLNEIVQYADKNRYKLIKQTHCQWDKTYFNLSTIRSIRSKMPFYRWCILYLYKIAPSISFCIFTAKRLIL